MTLLFAGYQSREEVRLRGYTVELSFFSLSGYLLLRIRLCEVSGDIVACQSGGRLLCSPC